MADSTLRTWLLQAVRDFRSLGFFQRYPGRTDDEVAAALYDRIGSDLEEQFDPADPFSDLLLLRADESRVWWEDTEADVCEDNKVYEQVLPQWSKISRGAFQPKNIRETWHGEEGPVEVRFDHGRAVRLQPKFLEDYIDLGILLPINDLIGKSSIQFNMYEAFDQTAFIVALTTAEKQRLERERGWRFAF